MDLGEAIGHVLHFIQSFMQGFPSGNLPPSGDTPIEPAPSENPVENEQPRSTDHKG